MALIAGAFVIAAFAGVVMNFSYMFAGSAGVPAVAILGVFLVLAGRWRFCGTGQRAPRGVRAGGGRPHRSAPARRSRWRLEPLGMGGRRYT